MLPGATRPTLGTEAHIQTLCAELAVKTAPGTGLKKNIFQTPVIPAL